MGRPRKTAKQPSQAEMDNMATLMERLDDAWVNPGLARSPEEVRNALEVGALLCEVLDNKYYKMTGSKTSQQFVIENSPYGKTMSYDLVAIIRNFCETAKDGKRTPILKEKYKGFSISQLIELLATPAWMHPMVSPDMKVRDIKKLRDNLTGKEPSPKQSMQNLYDSLNEVGKARALELMRQLAMNPKYANISSDAFKAS